METRLRIGQHAVPALPSTLTFGGLVADSLGFAIYLHLLKLHLTRLVFGVRSRDKGEAAKAQLLADPIVAALEHQPSTS